MIFASTPRRLKLALRLHRPYCAKNIKVGDLRSFLAVSVLILAVSAVSSSGAHAADWRTFSAPALYAQENDVFGAEMKAIAVQRFAASGELQSEEEAMTAASTPGLRVATLANLGANRQLLEKNFSSASPADRAAVEKTEPWIYWLDLARAGDPAILGLMGAARDDGKVPYLSIPVPHLSQIALPYGEGKVILSVFGAVNDAATRCYTPNSAVHRNCPAVALVLDREGAVRAAVRFDAPYVGHHEPAPGVVISAAAAIEGARDAAKLHYRVTQMVDGKMKTFDALAALPPL